jgi:hypothetical protein
MSECDIARAFWMNDVGVVDRVDFFENSAGVWCAFVHFEEFYDNEFVSRIFNSIEIYGSNKFWFSETEYFILREMKCPKIPATSMNIHQIADKLTQHEAKIVENDARIAELEAKISEQNKIIEVKEKLACRPCGDHGKKSCPEIHFNCANSIDVHEMLQAYQAFLASGSK